MCAQSLSRVWLLITPCTVAPRLLCPWNFLSKNTGAGCHFLLQWILLTQGLNPISCVFCITGGFFTCYAIREAQLYIWNIWVYWQSSFNWKFSIETNNHIASLQARTGKESVYNVGDQGSIPGWEDPWRRKWPPTPIFLSGASHEQRSLVGYSQWGHKRVGHDSVIKPPPPPRAVAFNSNSLCNLCITLIKWLQKNSFTVQYVGKLKVYKTQSSWTVSSYPGRQKVMTSLQHS